MEHGIFYRPRQLVRAITSMSIAVGLFVLSSTNHLDFLKNPLDSFTNKIFIFNQGANSIINNLSSNFKDIDALSSEYEDLQREVVDLKIDLARLKAIEDENKQLKNLLKISTVEVAYKKVVNVINTEQGAKNHIIFIDKGSIEGIFVGQNIYDAYGLIGQVISVSDNSARVLLLTDNNSFVPAYNLSNKEQYMVRGNNSVELEVLFFQPKSNLEIGDYLYTSGLGGKYLANYPIAIIAKIIRDSNGNILNVYAKPLSQLNSLRYMVAVWPYCHQRPLALDLKFDTRYRKVLTEKYNFNPLSTKNFLNYEVKGLSPEHLPSLRTFNYPDAIATDSNPNLDYNLHNCIMLNR